MRLRSKKIVLSAALLGLVAGVPGSADHAEKEGRKTSAQATSATSTLDKLGQGIKVVSLRTVDNNTVTWGKAASGPRAVFFGFTHCPVVCPVTVWELDSALTELGKDAGKIQIVFVSLDPARDTVSVIKEYFSGFSKDRMIALTGAQSDISRLAKAFEVSSEKIATKKGAYTLDHTATVFLIAPSGRVVDTIAFGTPRNVTLSRLKALAKTSK